MTGRPLSLVADGSGSLPALEMLCPDCDGQGELPARKDGLTWRMASTCPTCRGVRTVKTEEGVRLLQFLARHAR